MRDLRHLNAHRDRKAEREMARMMGAEEGPDSHGGFFWVRSGVDGLPLKVIASRWMGSLVNGTDPPWDHVSVSRGDRCPTWEEMEQVKHLFFLPDEVAFQLHVPPSDHISLHPYCLHIWRPCVEQIPMPPAWMVA